MSSPDLLPSGQLTCKNVDESTAGCIIASVSLNEGNRPAEVSRPDTWCGNESVNAKIVSGTQIEAERLIHRITTTRRGRGK